MATAWWISGRLVAPAAGHTPGDRLELSLEVDWLLLPHPWLWRNFQGLLEEQGPALYAP